LIQAVLCHALSDIYFTDRNEACRWLSWPAVNDLNRSGKIVPSFKGHVN